jgi:hypothetical protein
MLFFSMLIPVTNTVIPVQILAPATAVLLDPTTVELLQILIPPIDVHL